MKELKVLQIFVDHRKFIGFIVFWCVLYVVFYSLIMAYPEDFLVEGSVTSYGYSFLHQIRASGVVTQQIHSPHTVYVKVIHYGWLTSSLEKHFLSITLLVISYSLTNRFSGKPETFKDKIFKAFSIFALFVGFWTFSLMFVPPVGYDYALSLALTVTSIVLLCLGGLYLVAKAKAKGFKGSMLNKTLGYIGVIMAIWLVAMSFLGEWASTMFAFATIIILLLYVAAKLLGKIAEHVKIE